MLTELHKKFEELDLRTEAFPKSHFLSTWNGKHPYVQSYLAELGDFFTAFSPEDYSILEDDLDLKVNLRSMHLEFGENISQETEFFLAGGATPLISALCFWIREKGDSMVHYVAPLHFTFGYAFKTAKIRPIRINPFPLFEPGAELSLPSQKSVLILTDPIWFAGKLLSSTQMDQLKTWQENTGSYVIVDGTFQYMRWDGIYRELSSELLPHLTLRIVCPTKSLGINGFRFAYLLLPARNLDSFALVFHHLHGAASLSTLLFAHVAVKQLSKSERNHKMIAWTRSNFEHLRSGQWLEEYIEPEAGYFLFARTKLDLDQYAVMDQSFFELAGYPGYIRLNLMNPEVLSIIES